MQLVLLTTLPEEPPEDQAEPVFELPSELGTPGTTPTQVSNVGGVSSNPKPTPASSYAPLGFITATPGLVGDDIADNEAWINTYPNGAMIYIVTAKESLSDVEVTDIVKSENLVGIAPVIFELPPGSYYLVAQFSSNLFASGGFSLPNAFDFTFDDAFPFDDRALRIFIQCR